jgi:O-antigen ligase
MSPDGTQAGRRGATAWDASQAAAFAGGAGSAAAAVHFAGALKSLPGVAALPVDLTVAAAAAMLPLLLLTAADRRWHLDRALAAPLAGCVLLPMWLAVAGSWSASAVVLAEKLPQAALLGPAMLVAGALVGADAAARRGFCSTTLGIGLLVGGAVAWGVATDAVVLGGAPGADPARVRVQYQIAGLSIACAAGLAALRLVEARSAAARLAWSIVALLLAMAALVPGGRAALLGLGLGVAGAPALRLWLADRRGASLLWCAAAGVAGLGGLAILAEGAPGLSNELRTVERIFGEAASATPARTVIWDEALRWAGSAAPLGLGTGGFTLAAGFGDARALHPHNHALEALAEGGLPGLVFWLLAFGGGAALAAARSGRVAPGRAARIAALTLPVGLSVMVSTDLGNRMAWFALGLLLSLGLEARRGGRDV